MMSEEAEPVGDGKYKGYADLIFEDTKARAVCLVVIDGNLGCGVSVVGDAEMQMEMPDILERLGRSAKGMMARHPGGPAGFVAEMGRVTTCQLDKKPN